MRNSKPPTVPVPPPIIHVLEKELKKQEPVYNEIRIENIEGEDMETVTELVGDV